MVLESKLITLNSLDRFTRVKLISAS